MTTIYSKSGTDAAISAATGALTPEDVGADPAGTAAAAITTLGLGTAATTDATDYATAAQGVKADASDVHQITLTGNLALTIPAEHPAGQVYRCVFTQDAAGGHTVTYGGQPVAVALTAGASTTIELVPVGAGYVVRYPASPETFLSTRAFGGLLPGAATSVTVGLVGSNPYPIEVIDGVVWGTVFTTGQIHCSTDEGATWTLYATLPAAATIRRLMTTSDGEMLVLAAERLYKSSGWGSGSPTFSVVSTPNGSSQFQAWGFDGDGTRFLTTEYSGTRPDSRYARMSHDAGATWQVAYDSEAQHGKALADGSHLHGCCYDPWGDRWYLSEGHDDGGTPGQIAGVYCSADNGATWTRAAGMAQNPAPTVLVATPAGLVCGSDNVANGMYGVRREADLSREQLRIVWRWQTGRAGLVGFASRGTLQPETGVVYMGWVTAFGDVPPIISAGTVESGELVWSWPNGQANSDRVSHVIMPSRDRFIATVAISNVLSLASGTLGAPSAVSASLGDTSAILGGASASGDSLAVGRSASVAAGGIRNTAVGMSSAVTSGATDATSVGYGATAAANGVALGASANAGGSLSTAVGKSATTGALTEATAIGASASVTGGTGTAVGRSATASTGGVAVGKSATAAANGVALGASANAAAGYTYGVALGTLSVTNANNQVQIMDRHVEIKELAADPPAPAVNAARLFVRDGGSGKTQLCVRFATGAVQVIATEP